MSSEQDTDYLPHIRLPEGATWTCAVCGATGDRTTQTLREHYEDEHGGV